MESKKGLIFHTIRGSFVDGHGVRTTTFLKGCPLRCVWCCNPEGQQTYPELKFTEVDCTGCGKCLSVCPVNAIKPKGAAPHKISIDRNLCTNCGKCIDSCYTEALDWFGKYYTVDEIFTTLKKDEKFYDASGGGVTIGGGEPTFQAEFTYELMKKCQGNSVPTAIDTCGFTQTDLGLKILEEADLLLFDLKGMDHSTHIRSTGVSNELIIANLKKLTAKKKSIIIRLPLIPGHTDSAQNIKATAEFLAGLKSIERVDILPYHEYGKIKYEQLGRKYTLNARLLTEQKIAEIKNTFEKFGLKTQVGG